MVEIRMLDQDPAKTIEKLTAAGLKFGVDYVFTKELPRTLPEDKLPPAPPGHRWERAHYGWVCCS